MSLENKQLMQRWFEEVWNQGRSDAIDEMFAENGIAHGLSDESGKPLSGPAGFRVFHAQFREAFPGITVVVDDMAAEGDKVAVRCTVRGKHEGASLGFAATETEVDFAGIVIVRIAAGQIVEAWNHFDFMRMYQQLGALNSVAAKL